MKTTTLGIVLCALVVFPLVHFSSRQAGATTFTKVVATGEVPIGFPDAIIADTGGGKLTDAGLVSFNVNISGPGITTTNDSVRYVGSPAAPEVLYRESQQAPSFPAGVNITSGLSSRDWYGDDGRMIFNFNIVGPGVTTTTNGLSWIGTPGNVVPLMREGDPAPGVPGATIGSLNNGQGRFDLTSTGKIMKFQPLTTGVGGVTTANDNVIFYGTSPANFTAILREGNPVPDGPVGARINEFATYTIARGDHLLIQGTMVPGEGGVTSADDSVLWLTNGAGQLKLASREGNVIAGLPGLVDPGTQHQFNGEIVMNSMGVVLNYNAELLQDGIHASSSNNRVVEVGSAESPFIVVAREGTQAPGLPAGVNFGNSFGEGRIADDGKIALQNLLTGTGITGANDLALYYGEPDALHLVAREGSQAPGFDPGVNFNSWSSSGFMATKDMLVLSASVSDGLGFDSTGLFATNPTTGVLELLLKPGDTLETAPGIFKEVSSFNITLSHNQQSMNNLHQVIFSADFTDDSNGVFIANVGVPEPASFLLLGTGVSILSLRRKRRAEGDVRG